MLKRTLRSNYLEKRIKLDEIAHTVLSGQIVDHFSHLALPSIKYILSYYPLTNKKEFDVSKCAAMVLEKSPIARIAWPRIDAEFSTMEAFQLETDGLFAKNEYNILEPISGEWVPPELIDLVFVPLLAVDKNGHRIGYGKGFYDRYLKRCRSTVPTIGFSFFDPVDSIRDIDEFDVPLSLCITPSGIYEF